MTDLRLIKQPRRLDISTPSIPNAVVLVDEDDWEFVRRFKWTPKQNTHITYAVSGQSGRNIYMHREIARARMTEIVDHIDGDGLNNQKSNLRLCNNQENQQNRKRRRVKSGLPYKNVFPRHNKSGTTYFAHISKDGVRKNLGTFPTPEAAAEAYDRAAVAMFGEFAKTNFDVSRYV